MSEEHPRQLRVDLLMEIERLKEERDELLQILRGIWILAADDLRWNTHDYLEQIETDARCAIVKAETNQ